MRMSVSLLYYFGILAGIVTLIFVRNLTVIGPDSKQVRNRKYTAKKITAIVELLDLIHR